MNDGKTETMWNRNVRHEGSMRRDLNVFDYVGVIYRYRWVVLPVCILAMAATFVVYYLQPPTYVATTSIVPPRESGSSQSGLGAGLLGAGSSSLLRNVMDVSSVADMYVGIMESRAVLNAIVDRFDLIDACGAGRISRFEARAKLKGHTSINVSEEGIVYVAVEDPDPNRAAAIANAYVEELDRQNKRLSVGRTSSKRKFLEGRVTEIEAKLRKSEDIPRREEQIQEMLYERLMLDLELAKIEEAKSMPTIQVLDPATPPEVRKGKGAVRKAALAGIVAAVCVIFFAFGRDYVQACRHERLAGRYASSIDTGYEGAEVQEGDARKSIPVVERGRSSVDGVDIERVGSQHA